MASTWKHGHWHAMFLYGARLLQDGFGLFYLVRSSPNYTLQIFQPENHLALRRAI